MKKILILIYELILLSFVKSQTVDLIFEYPYSCGTWFNRGKNTCNFIKEKLESNKIHVLSTIKPFHMGEFPNGYDGEFNIYLNRNDNKILLATSKSKSQFYQSGLKYFAYTFFKTDNKTGERNYIEEFPQKNELLDYILKRTIEELKVLRHLK